MTFVEFFSAGYFFILVEIFLVLSCLLFAKQHTLVSVWNVYSAGDALPLAKRHCASYGKDAVFTNMSGFITANFQCR